MQRESGRAVRTALDGRRSPKKFKESEYIDEEGNQENNHKEKSHSKPKAPGASCAD